MRADVRRGNENRSGEPSGDASQDDRDVIDLASIEAYRKSRHLRRRLPAGRPCDESDNQPGGLRNRLWALGYVLKLVVAAVAGRRIRKSRCR
ncbi:hypothetical protein [Nakamurella aerolata]|uniref:Uncharacterized protein n=1 Tax=Nakamurella aerolata TaxID=1656892 RepID=A0A849A695_9ACTN|nr:hypothetical protein [Nakamurella aerolata]NNG36504.1 hypothetical protein [Nakamurella aerolata]